MPASTVVKSLPRLPVNWKDQPQLFERYWDELCKRIEKIEKNLNTLLP